MGGWSLASWGIALCSIYGHPGWEVRMARETPLTPDLVALGPRPSFAPLALSAFVLFLQAGSPAEPFFLS